VNDSLIQRIKKLGAIPTPFSTYVYYHGEKMREYGADRLNSMFAVRSFLDAGVRVTQASDYPPGPFEPMMALQSSVTRTDDPRSPTRCVMTSSVILLASRPARAGSSVTVP